MRKSDRNWSADEINYIASRWKDGFSASTIAAEVGPNVTKNMIIGLVYRRRMNVGISRRRQKQAHPARDRIVRLRTAGLRNCEIARKLGISDETVWSNLNEAKKRGELAAAMERVFHNS